jgi:peptide-methionine (S)-S-oxide reductase
MKKLLTVALMPLLIGLFFVSVYAQAENSGSEAANLQTAYFAGGCFWKSQFIFSKVKGVVDTKVGYTGGTVPDPNYHMVCGDKTGHAETVKVVFDPAKVSYRHLLEVFFAKFDPTTLNRQGPDVGTQYRSIIFYTSPAQKEEATNYKLELERQHKFSSPIVTEIVPASKFYDAEDYHQNYFVKHGEVCQ